mgnify:FL=1
MRNNDANVLFSNEIRSYLYGGLVVSAILGIGLLVNSNVEPLVLFWQIGSMFAFLMSIGIVRSLSIGKAIGYIVIYQMALSFLLNEIFFSSMLSRSYDFNPVDAILYKKIIARAFIKPYDQIFANTTHFLAELSDQGFPFVLGSIYRLTNGDIGLTKSILVIINLLSQAGALFFTYQIGKRTNLSHSQIMWGIALWGLNSASIYFNVVMLKEPIFLFLCMGTIYFIYRARESKTVMLWHVLTIFFILLTWFFRYYMSLFFIIVYIAYCHFPHLYVRFFSVFCIAAIVICLVTPGILGMYMDEIAFINKSNDLYFENKSWLFKVTSAPITLWGPIPRFNSIEYLSEQFLLTFSVPKFFMSSLAVYGAFKAIQNKKSELYPLISITLFTALLLVVSHHMLDYRYAYIVMPCTYILIVFGATFKSKWLYPTTIVIASLAMILYNLQIHK